MMNPIWERRRNTYNLMDSMTSFGAQNMLRLSIALQSAFGYCMCYQNAVTVALKDGTSGRGR